MNKGSLTQKVVSVPGLLVAESVPLRSPTSSFVIARPSLDPPNRRVRCQAPRGIGHLNIGSGDEISIRDLAGTIAEVIGYKGEIVLDAKKPNGTPRKVMDSSRLLKFGWAPSVALKVGIAETYR